MEAFALPLLFTAVVAVLIWGMIDNARHDREGIRKKREAEASEQREMARQVRDGRGGPRL